MIFKISRFRSYHYLFRKGQCVTTIWLTHKTYPNPKFSHANGHGDWDTCPNFTGKKLPQKDRSTRSIPTQTCSQNQVSTHTYWVRHRENLQHSHRSSHNCIQYTHTKPKTKTDNAGSKSSRHTHKKRHIPSALWSLSESKAIFKKCCFLFCFF